MSRPSHVQVDVTSPFRDCPVTPEHTRDYFHMPFYIVYIPHLNDLDILIPL